MLVLLILSIVLFFLAACADYGWLGMTSTHELGLIALGLTAFAAAHLPIPNYFR